MRGAQNPKLRKRIPCGMAAWLMGAVLLLSYPGVAGTFRGMIVRGPDAWPGWVYVAGRNHSLRRVEVSRASVTYDDGVPMRLRKKNPRQSLAPGADVRVTADQDDQGEWRATEIEILRLPRRTPPSRPLPFRPPGTGALDLYTCTAP